MGIEVLEAKSSSERRNMWFILMADFTPLTERVVSGQLTLIKKWLETGELKTSLETVLFDPQALSLTPSYGAPSKQYTLPVKNNPRDIVDSILFNMIVNFPNYIYSAGFLRRLAYSLDSAPNAQRILLLHFSQGSYPYASDMMRDMGRAFSCAITACPWPQISDQANKAAKKKQKTMLKAAAIFLPTNPTQEDFEKFFDQKRISWVRIDDSGLRGFSGTREIYLNTTYFEQNYVESERFEQILLIDLITLICHETTHAFIRYHVDDLNVSSPDLYKQNTQTTTIPRNNQESGKLFEILYFGFQPDLRKCEDWVEEELNQLTDLMVNGKEPIVAFMTSYVGLQRSYPSEPMAVDCIRSPLKD